MVNRSKQKGTSWESAIVDYLRENGVPHAERRALNGAKDRGDVAGIVGVVIEAKSAQTFTLSAWLDEALTERDNDRADIGVVWAKRPRKASPGAGYVIMDGDTLLWLLRSAGYLPGAPHDAA